MSTTDLYSDAVKNDAYADHRRGRSLAERGCKKDHAECSTTDEASRVHGDPFERWRSRPKRIVCDELRQPRKSKRI
jgi:hypothetical protein